VRITVVARDALLELVGGQVIHELSEDGLAEIHTSLSEFLLGFDRGGFPGSFLLEKFQIEKSKINRSPLILRRLLREIEF